MVMGLAGRENGGKAKNCRVRRRVLARYIGILLKILAIINVVDHVERITVVNK